MEEIEYHKQRCLDYYIDHQGTMSRGTDIHFYSKEYTQEELKELTLSIKSEELELWDKYLSRYEIE